MDILLTHSINDLFIIKEIHGVHEMMSLSAGFISKRESHECCEFAYVSGGELIQYAGDEEIHLSAGDVYFIKPGVEHGVKVINGDTTLLNCSFKCTGQYMNILNGSKIHVPKDLRKCIGSLKDEFSQSFYIAHSDNGMYHPVIKDQAPIGGQQQFIAYLETFLIQMLRIKLVNEELNFFYDKDNHQNAIVNSVNELLETNLRGYISIDDICEKLAVSRTFLCTLYKKRTGDTIIHRLNTLKMQEAANQIKDSNLKLFEIAEILGFSDQYYFSRLFKKVHGISPMEYKTKYKKS